MSWLRVPKIDLTRLEKLPDALTLVFYAFMFFALVATLAGSPGFGFLLLIIGAAGHVVRAGLEDFAAQQGDGKGEPEIAIRRVSKPKAEAKAKVPRRSAGTRPPVKARPKAEVRPREGSASTRRSAQR